MEYVDAPIFKPYKKKPKFFMPHFPIFTGNAGAQDVLRIKFLLEKLYSPQKALKNVIHVVGTNGKGSTCAYLKSILTEAGFKVCVFTSPHLHAANERIEINGEHISDRDLFLFSEKVRFLCEEQSINITIFESLTIVAVLLFAQSEADFFIFEAGMGGERDATNIFEKENVIGTIVTSISLDHTKFLGESLSEIAAHKLGILKAERPVVMQPFSGEILLTVLQKIAERNARAVFFGRDYNFSKIEFEDGDFGIEFQGKRRLILPFPPLIGDHQLYNLAAVISFLDEIGLNLSSEVISGGILNAKWPGRLERVVEREFLSLLPLESEIWFDGAHNEGGARALATWLESAKEGFINVLIVGKTRGSEVKNFILPFKGIVQYGFALEGKGEIYPEFAGVLLEGFKSAEIKGEKTASIKAALISINALFKSKVRVVICGSLYLARDLSFEA